jgi:type I restriction enzyme M protein
MLIKGEEADNIKSGDTFVKDGFPRERFDYMLANPPFGVEWKQQARTIIDEKEKLGYDGRFGAGLPRINDGSLLFLQHMISKMRQPEDGGSRIAIVFNGSPLFTGDAGSGESEIRRWIIENDWLEAIVAMPDQLFYNTGISTYVWVLTNRKEKKRKGKIQLIDARQFYVKMRKSLGNKRNQIGDGEDGRPDQITDITRIYGNFRHDETRPVEIDGVRKNVTVSKIFDNEDFGYSKITVESPLRDENGNPAVSAKGKNKGKPDADPDLRDTENVPLKEKIDAYFKRDVLPHVPDAWIDYDKTKIGYEIPLNRHFYKYEPPRALEAIEADIRGLETEIVKMLAEVTGSKK